MDKLLKFDRISTSPHFYFRFPDELAIKMLVEDSAQLSAIIFMSTETTGDGKPYLL